MAMSSGTKADGGSDIVVASKTLLGSIRETNRLPGRKTSFQAWNETLGAFAGGRCRLDRDST
jgi:hypothetical protein